MKSSNQSLPPAGWVAIGRVLATHGVNGAVKVRALTDNPDRFPALREVGVQLASGLSILQVEQVRPCGRELWLVKFREFSRPEDAAGLGNREVWIREEELADLPEGSYYIFEIEGLDVYTVEGELLGQVVDVLATGGNDVWVVGKASGRGELLLPALKGVVLSVDRVGRRIVVQPPPGLLDDGGSVQ